MSLKDVTAEQLRAERPELVAAIESAAAEKARAEALAEGEKAGREAGAKAERERITGIQAHSDSGMEAMIAEMVADGATTPDQAAGRVLAAQKERRHKALNNMVEDDASAAAVKPAANLPGDDKPALAKDPKALAAAARQLMREASAAGETLSPDVAVARALENAA